MMLYDKNYHEVAYCLVNTPPDLIKYEDERLHDVEHIPEERRITRIIYERSQEKEELIKQKCIAAQDYFQAVLDEIHKQHGG